MVTPLITRRKLTANTAHFHSLNVAQKKFAQYNKISLAFTHGILDAVWSADSGGPKQPTMY